MDTNKLRLIVCISIIFNFQFSIFNSPHAQWWTGWSQKTSLALCLHQTDSTFTADELGRRKREKYVNKVQKELFNAFEQPMRNMTVTQGQLLMKLVDREVGKSSFSIIKDYKNGIAAGFWQGVAKLFGSDLKKHYDPAGADRQVEELVQKWDSGEFPALYFSIFGEYPKVVEIPSKYM